MIIVPDEVVLQWKLERVKRDFERETPKLKAKLEQNRANEIEYLEVSHSIISFTEEYAESKYRALKNGISSDSKDSSINIKLLQEIMYKAIQLHGHFINHIIVILNEYKGSEDDLSIKFILTKVSTKTMVFCSEMISRGVSLDDCTLSLNFIEQCASCRYLGYNYYEERFDVMAKVIKTANLYLKAGSALKKSFINNNLPYEVEYQFYEFLERIFLLLRSLGASDKETEVVVDRKRPIYEFLLNKDVNISLRKIVFELLNNKYLLNDECCDLVLKRIKTGFSYVGLLYTVIAFSLPTFEDDINVKRFFFDDHNTALFFDAIQVFAMLPKNYKINENIILNGSQEQKKEYLKKLELENNSHKEKSALYIEKMVSIAYKK